MAQVKIYIADWEFEGKTGLKYISKDVVTKKIPLAFLLDDGVTYQRAMRCFSEKHQSDMLDDKKTKKKKVKIIYKKFLGYADTQSDMAGTH